MSEWDDRIDMIAWMDGWIDGWDDAVLLMAVPIFIFASLAYLMRSNLFKHQLPREGQCGPMDGWMDGAQAHTH